MSVALPKVVDYSESMYSLPPNTQSFQVVCNPISGSSFGASSQIDVDLGSRGYLDPKSLFIRYKITTTNAAVGYMAGTPVYSPFQRLSVMMNSQTVETIPNYNVVSNVLTNLNKDVSQKMGEQAAYGYYDNTSTPVTNEQTDGGTFAVNGYKYLSAPLICSLSNCEKLIPLFLLNGIRLTFTLDSAANIFSQLDNAGGAIIAGNQVTAYSITNFEVCYNCVDFGDDVKEMHRGFEKIRIKSQTWASSVQSLASGISGQQNLIFNHKYSSVKALFLNMGGADRTKSSGGLFDSYNVAGATGDYQFQVAGINYPQRVLSCNTNYTGIIQMLRQAIGSVFDKNTAMSINSLEFFTTSGGTTSVIAPAKFFVGVSTEKIKIPGSFFTGISTEASPISAVININTATSQAHNVMMIVNADLIYEIDPQTKQVVVIQ
jgi:hypothetical protein